MPWPLSCQWGRVPRREPSYVVGDRIEWLTGRRGEVLAPYTYVEMPARGLFGVPHVVFNIGEPSVRELFALEADLTMVEGVGGTQCEHCGVPWATWGAHIVEGVLRGARAFTPDEVASTGATLDEMNLIEIVEGGGWRARTDWFVVALRRYDP